MDGFEWIVLLLSGYWALRFLRKWYRALRDGWPGRRTKFARTVLEWLPAAALVIIAFVLTALASFDVVSDFQYILLYLALGFAWIAAGMQLLPYCLDLSWRDDALERNNRAALFAVSGGFLGFALIYAGANVGDGPGWWCVLFAAGLGTASYLLLMMLVGAFGHLPERITVERDVPAGIRFGLYLLASALLLARASAGDWTSFCATVVEFLDGWPVLPLTALAIAVERYYLSREAGAPSAAVWGALYVALAVLGILLLPPLRENPLYGGAP
jgi:hypothetical protein